MWMGRTEVTVGAFRRFVEGTGFVPSSEAGPDGPRGRIYLEAGEAEEIGWAWVRGVTWARPLDPEQPAPDEWPVAQVTPRDAEAFCAWTGGRLPTEAEWEFSARGGREGTIHVWGNQGTPEVAGDLWANGPDQETADRFPSMGTFEGYHDGFAALAPVGLFRANAFGLYDMAGNVYEFTADAYTEDTYSADTRIDPSGPTTGLGRAVRGGSWGYEPEHHRVSWRGYFSDASDFWTATLGFRCVLDEAPS